MGDSEAVVELSIIQKHLNIIREYYKAGLITDNEIPKHTVKLLHRRDKQVFYNIPAYHAIRYFARKKIIFRPNESGKPDMIIFKPGKLDTIIAGLDDYIAKTETKKIVSQNLGFHKLKDNKLSCSFCIKTFFSELSLEMHNKEKSHIVSKLKKQLERPDGFINTTDVCAEIVKGAGNSSETIFNEEAEFETYLKISNNSTSTVTLDEIVSVNSAYSKHMNFTYKRCDIPVQKTYEIPLILSFDSQRSYSMPLIITYNTTDSTGNLVIEGFAKMLIFEIASKNLQKLQPITRYKRPQLIISDMDENIIPGEKPEFLSDFVEVHKLQTYKLTPEHINIFNSGLKIVPKDEAEKRLYLKIKPLLDVGDPIKCLTPANYRDMLDLLLYLEEHQMKIDIRHYDTITDQLTHIRNNMYELVVPELSENRPSLLIGDSVLVKVPGVEGRYEGIVHEKLMDSVKLGFNAKFANVYVKKMKFEVSFIGFNRTTLKLEHQAVKLARDCTKYFFPKPLPPSSQQDLSINCYNRNIRDNEQQLQAVREIVKGTAGSVPYLIYGPPGTGKTMTIVEAILQVRKHYKDKRILICASSNSAANLICERILDFSSFSEKELLRYISYSYNQSDLSDTLRKYCNFKNGVVSHPTMETLRTFKLIVATLTTAGRLYNCGMPKDHYHYVFIDEAGHATESETLIPITAVLVNQANVNGRVILAGDPEQLGPIIHSTVAKRYGFGISMLERLMTTNSIYKKDDGFYDNRVLTKLLKNYRSHPEIIALSNEICYDGELIPVGNEFSNIALGHDILPNKKFPLIFHSVLGHDDRESNSPSFFNIQEIAIVFKYLNSLIGCKMSGYKVTANDIAIITPYRKQVQKLREMCRYKNKNDPKYDGLEIGSIEKLQGQERLIVIISTVRCKPEYVRHDVKFHLGFLKNKKRMNVALTRAKALLIVVGNPNLLKYDENWRKVIQRCVDNKATDGAPFSMELENGGDFLDAFKNIRIEDDVHFGRGSH